MPATLPELEHTVFPPEDRAPLSRVATFVEAHRERAAMVGPDGALVDLPSEVYSVLIDVVEAMHAGRAITVAPQSTRLTTTQAANLLGISRPTLVKLLEAGAIAFEQPGRHRRVRLADVLAYRDRRRDERRRSWANSLRTRSTPACTTPLRPTTRRRCVRLVDAPPLGEQVRCAPGRLRPGPGRAH